MEFIKLILEIIKQFFELRTRSNAVEKQLERYVQLYDAMSVLSATKGVTRVSIVKVENSGGLIDPKVSLYASVLHEDYSHPATAIKQKFDKLPVDQSYVRLVLKTIKEGFVLLNEETIEKGDNMVSNIYRSGGVKAAKIYFLGSTPKAIYLMSVSSLVSNDFYEADSYKMNRYESIAKIKKALWNEKN